LADVIRRTFVREKAPKKLGHMKTLKYLQIVAGAGLVFVGAGCVHEHVTYVTQVPPQGAPAPEPQPPAAPPPIIRSSGELDRMLGPIALYADPLIAQLLPAASFPDQVATADRYLRTGGDVLQIEYQPWEPSVKAITRYPDVVRMMAGDLLWTSDVGMAFVNQEGDVMDSVQRLRAQARGIGNLQTTPQQVVIVEGRVIQIVPATPEIIYVPVYRPEIVFVQPPPRVGLHVVFGPPLPIGPWMNHDLNWRNREVIVWHQDHPRPHDWWYEPPSRHEHTTVVNNTTIVNNYTIYQPRDHRPAVPARAPAQAVHEREAQARNPEPRNSHDRVTATAPTVPPAVATTTRPLPQRQLRLAPTNHVATTAHPHSTTTAPRKAPNEASKVHANGAAANGQPALTETTSHADRRSQGQGSAIPLSIETHRDPVPATISSPHERENAPQAKPNANAHPGSAANPAGRAVAQAEGKPDKKGKAEAKGQAKKAGEHEGDSDNSPNHREQSK